MKKKEIEVAKFLVNIIGKLAWEGLSKDAKYRWVEIAKETIEKINEEKKKS